MAAEPVQPPWDNAYEAAPPQEWFHREEWFRMVHQTADPDLRAHRIALTYYHLGAYFDTFLHGDDASTRQSAMPSVPLNANWFHFAMWGTLTVTQNVTTQRSPQRLNSGLPTALRRTLTPAILRARASDGQRVGRALAWGQLAIFASATQMVSESKMPGIENSEDDTLAEINNKLGACPIDLDLTRHIRPLKAAFRYYANAHNALTNLDRVTHAWRMFGANVLMTTVEQDLADRAIEVVLDHVPDHVASAIDWRLAKLSARFRGVPPHLAYAFLRSMHPNQRRLIYAIWSRLMTDQVLVMSLPTEALRLGRDIPPKNREWPVFPPDLREFPNPDPAAEEASDMRAIVSLVKSLDRTVAGAGTRGSAARDWRRWDERMNWAVALIRSRQQDETLFWAPYSVADQWRIVDGKMPERLGDASTLEVQAPTDRVLVAIDRETRGGP